MAYSHSWSKGKCAKSSRPRARRARDPASGVSPQPRMRGARARSGRRGRAGCAATMLADLGLEVARGLHGNQRGGSAGARRSGIAASGRARSPSARASVDRAPRLVEPARRQREHRLVECTSPELGGLPELGGDGCSPPRARRCRSDIARRAAEPCSAAMCPATTRSRSPAARGHVTQLAPSARHSAIVSGATIACRAAVEGIARATPALPVRRASSTASRLSASRRSRDGLVAERSREPGEQPGRGARRPRRKRRQRLLEQRHEPIVVARPRPHDPPAVARGRPRELARARGAARCRPPRGRSPSRRRRLAGAALRLAEREQQLAARRSSRGPRARARRARARRAAPPPRRRAARAPGRRRAARSGPPCSSSPPASAVVGELGQMRARARRRRAPRAPRRRGGAGATRRARGEPLVERVADQRRARSAARPAAPGTSDDDPRRDRLVERSSSSLLRRCRLIRASAPSANSRPSTDAQHEQRACTPRRDARAGARSRRGRSAGSRALAAPSSADALEREQPHDLADEERVALRLVVQRRDQLRRGELGAVSSTYSATSPSLRPPSVDPPRRRLAGELGEHARRAARRHRIDVAVGAEDEEPASSRARGRRTAGAAATARRPRGGRRGRARAAASPRRSAGTAAVASKRRKRAPSDSATRGLRQVGEQLAELGQDLRELGRAGAELLAQCLRLGCRARRRAATASTASRPARRPPPSSARRAPRRRAPARARSSSSASRLLPIPGSPPIRNEPPAAREGVVEAARRASPARSRARRTRRVALALPRRSARARRSSAGSCREDRLVRARAAPARLDAELLDERAPRVLVGLERLGLAPER